MAYANIGLVLDATNVASKTLDISNLNITRSNSSAFATLQHNSPYANMNSTSVSATISEDGKTVQILAINKDNDFTLGQSIICGVMIVGY